MIAALKIALFLLSCLLTECCQERSIQGIDRSRVLADLAGNTAQDQTFHGTF